TAHERRLCTWAVRLRSVSQTRLRVARVRDRGSNLCHEGLPLVLAEAQRPAFWVLGVSYRDLAAARLGDLYAVRPRVAVARPAPRGRHIIVVHRSISGVTGVALAVA